MCIQTNDTSIGSTRNTRTEVDIEPQIDYDLSILELMMQFGGTVNSQGKPIILWTSIQKKLSSNGILVSDNRINAFCDAIKSTKQLTYAQFRGAALHNIAFLKAIADGQLKIQDFEAFSQKLQYLFETVDSIHDGETAQYIPTLRDADPDQYGLAFTSVQGQFFETGDSRSPFSIQSVSKPIMMALALEQLGLDGLSKWVGVSPSGRAFNDSALLPDGRPFNPMVNAGAIMTSAVVASLSPELCSDNAIGSQQERAEELMTKVLLPTWNQLSGDGAVGSIGFDRDTFLAERSTGDTNFSLGHILRLKMGLPDKVSMELMMDFYFRSCSLKATCATLSVVAATLANGGKCPTTGKQVMSSETVRNLLSSMVLSGMCK
jgi:glutaminase